ncbi:MAG: hypothetical protein KC731_42055, partial [Myxococcales bacterium]|nr:hypothetical protein [Myxococcales bacterium]
MSHPFLLAAAEAAAEAAEEHHAVPPGVTYLFGLILALMILALALEEKIHAKKSLITGLFAVLSLFLATVFDLLPFQAKPGPHQGDAMLRNVFGESFELPIYIPAIDWGVIAIILGSSLFVDVVSKSGLFTWIA